MIRFLLLCLFACPAYGDIIWCENTQTYVVGTLVVEEQQDEPSEVTFTSFEPADVSTVLGTPVRFIPEALELLNRQRQQRGLGPLRLSSRLQSGAELKARTAASRRHKGHLGGSLYGANKEGIGYGTSKVFRACYAYTSPAGTEVGAAMYQGSDGWWYSCLLVDYAGPLAAKPGMSIASRRRFFRR